MTFARADSEISGPPLRGQNPCIDTMSNGALIAGHVDIGPGEMSQRLHRAVIVLEASNRSRSAGEALSVIFEIIGPT